jgi:hypothetical protein
MSDSVIPAATEPAPEAVPEATRVVAAEAAPEAPSAAPIATPAATPPATSKAAAIDLLLAQWAVEFLHDSPVSRATEAMNHFTTSALPALRQRLLSEV